MITCVCVCYSQQNGCAPMAESNVNKPPPGPARDYGKANNKGIRKACNHRCVNKNVYPYKSIIMHSNCITVLL